MADLVRRMNSDLLQKLIQESRVSPRLRAPKALHPDEYHGPQALINPIQPGSYIRPHRHAGMEIWVPVKGRLMLCIFDEDGNRLERVPLSHGEIVYFSVPEHTFHSAFAMEPDSVFLNISQGPFDPRAYKEFPSWAPEERADSAIVGKYLGILQQKFLSP